MDKNENKASEDNCKDKNCPFHGNLTPRGKNFTGVIIAKDTHKTATIEWNYRLFIPKYERSETRRTRIRVHNPSCINAGIGDVVNVVQTRPLSKTKNFVITENLGKEKRFGKKIEAKEESKEIIGKKERKKEEPENSKEKIIEEEPKEENK